MRLSDLPDSSASADGSAADRAGADQPAAGPPGTRDWQALADRLRRLPDAHPSSPGGSDQVWWRGPDQRAGGGQGEFRGDQARPGAAEPAPDGEPVADGEPDPDAEPGADGQPGGAAGGDAGPGPDADPDADSAAGAEDALAPGDQDPAGEGGRVAGQAGTGWLEGAIGDGGGRAAYRPWFAGGGPSEPGFAAGQDRPGHGPERPTGPAG
jgi:hypothetical protein